MSASLAVTSADARRLPHPGARDGRRCAPETPGHTGAVLPLKELLGLSRNRTRSGPLGGHGLKAVMGRTRWVRRRSFAVPSLLGLCSPPPPSSPIQADRSGA